MNLQCKQCGYTLCRCVMTPDDAARGRVEGKEERCFACGHHLRSGAGINADTRDGQIVIVGPECYRMIRRAGEFGYQPLQGGPRLYDNCERSETCR